MYITRIAKEIQKGNSISSANVPPGLSQDDAKKIRDTINNLKWVEILQPVNNKTRSLFIWGMAIHTATDVYAHSAYAYVYCRVEKKWKWEHLDHNNVNNPDYHNDQADKTGNTPKISYNNANRWDTAKRVGKLSVEKYAAGGTGTASDFNPSGAYSGAGVTQGWKIINLYSNIYTHDANVASNIYNYSHTRTVK